MYSSSAGDYLIIPTTFDPVPGLGFTIKVFSSSDVEMFDTRGGKYCPTHSRERERECVKEKEREGEKESARARGGKYWSDTSLTHTVGECRVV